MLLQTVKRSGSGDVPEDIIAMSSQVAVEIEQEGIVLLENEDDVLPLGDKNVNIFGAGSVVPFLGVAPYPIIVESCLPFASSSYGIQELEEPDVHSSPIYKLYLKLHSFHRLTSQLD